MLKKVLIGLLVVFVILQFIRPEKNSGVAATPTDIAHAVTVPADVQQILNTSCYDCHSNHTEYPWYTNVNPVGLWMNHHIEEGKRELNFSIAATYSKKKLNHKLEEVAEQIAEGEMPLKSYLIIHRNAALSASDAGKIADWVAKARAELASK